MKEIRYGVVYWLPIIAYCLLIFIQSAYPVPETLPKIPYADKLIHSIVYAALGMLFLRAFKTLGSINKGIMLMLTSIAASTLYGISDELHQLYVPFRDASLMDIAADALGSILGVLISAKWIFNCSFPR